MADHIGQQLGSYRLIRLIGQGGFAEVYLGEHVRLEMKAAIKVLYARLAGDEVRAFQQEAQIIASLSHPHIIRILDFDVQHGIPFLVLDYAPNGSLRTLHPRGIPLPFSLIADYVRQVADALQYAHNRKLIHRDIKPENMLVGEQETILLSDFGIATLAHSTSSMKTQGTAGTLAYMAPEQIQGKPRTASDQYALAVVVYQWITGELPFQGSSAEIIAQHLGGPVPPLREKVPDLEVAREQAILKALSKDPKERFESIQAFANAFVQPGDLTPVNPQSTARSPQSPEIRLRGRGEAPPQLLKDVTQDDPGIAARGIIAHAPRGVEVSDQAFAPESPPQATKPLAWGSRWLPQQKRRGYVLAWALTLIWLLLLLSAVLYTINKGTLQLPPHPIEMPYSTLYQQIQAGNVQTVTFIGQSDIVGTLKQPIAVTSVRGQAEVSDSFHVVPLPNGDPRLRELLINSGVQVFDKSPVDSVVTNQIVGIPLIIALFVIYLIGVLLFFRWKKQSTRRA